jgi:hypothetical protein
MNSKLFCLLICVVTSQLMIILGLKEISQHSFLPVYRKSLILTLMTNILPNLYRHAQNILCTQCTLLPADVNPDEKTQMNLRNLFLV